MSLDDEICKMSSSLSLAISAVECSYLFCDPTFVG